MAIEYPAFGQLSASNELRKQGILVSGSGVRSIRQRHDLETFRKRLKALEEKYAREGILYTEARPSLQPWRQQSGGGNLIPMR